MCAGRDTQHDGRGLVFDSEEGHFSRGLGDPARPRAGRNRCAQACGSALARRLIIAPKHKAALTGRALIARGCVRHVGTWDTWGRTFLCAPAQLKAVEKLPTKKQLIATIAGLVKQPATKLATGIKAVPRKLAVAIKAVRTLAWLDAPRRASFLIVPRSKELRLREGGQCRRNVGAACRLKARGRGTCCS